MADLIVVYTGAKPIVFDSAVALGVARAAAIAEIEAATADIDVAVARAEAAAAQLDTTWTPANLYSSTDTGGYFDHDVLTNMYVARAGTGAHPQVGDLVGYATDLSGNGNHWVAGSDGARPTLAITADGKHYLDFNGTATYGDAPMTVPQPFSRFNHVRQDVWTSGRVLFDGGAKLRQNNVSPQLSLDAGTIAGFSRERHIGYDQTIVEFFSGASSTVQQDDFPAQTASPGTGGLTLYRVGARDSGGSADLFADMRWYGGGAIGRELTGLEKQKLRDYYRPKRSFQHATKTFACYSDSLFITGASNSITKTVPARLVEELGAGYSAVNYAVPSQDTTCIAGRAGAFPWLITLASNAIPASGGVLVTIASPLSITGTQSTSGPLGHLNSGSSFPFNSIAVEITADDGTVIPGILSVGSAGVYTFTRFAIGEPKTASSGAEMWCRRHDWNFGPAVFNMGYNNASEARSETDLAAAVAAWSGPYIVFGLVGISNSTMYTGTAARISMDAKNAARSSTYGSSYFGAEAFLMNTGTGGAFDLMGITPDTGGFTDTAEIAAGICPIRWKVGGPDLTHFNDNGQQALGKGAKVVALALGI